MKLNRSVLPSVSAALGIRTRKAGETPALRPVRGFNTRIVRAILSLKLSSGTRCAVPAPPLIRSLCLLLLLVSLTAPAQTNEAFTRIRDIRYGHTRDQALTLDVFTPTNANGAGLLWLVSAGYGSSREAIQPRYFRALLARGYIVFAVTHGSVPKFSVPEIETDILRAARFVRHHAARFGVDTNRLGAVGASAGGHLALLLAVKGGAGVTNAADPVDRASSAVQCAAAFFPPTDYLNYGRPGREAEWIKPLLGVNPTNTPAERAADTTRRLREISVIYNVHSNQPPVLIFQGDRDYLVPVAQAETFVQRYTEAGNTAKLILKPGAGHGWPDMAADMETVADWFDAALTKTASADRP